MLSPFAPHIAEEMWEKLGYTELASKSAWPEFSKENVMPHQFNLKNY